MHRVVRVHPREAHVVRRVRGVAQAPQRLRRLLLLSRILRVSVVQVAALLLLLIALRRQEGLVVVRLLPRETSLV